MELPSHRKLDVDIVHARERDADGIAAVHVAVWRNAYAGILPERTLLGLSARRLAAFYGMGIVRGRGTLVARAAAGEVAGFCTFHALPAAARAAAPAEGEVETLYVHDDWREQGLGRALLAGAARRLREAGCRSLFLHVLADNNSRWFYARLGGREALRSTTVVGGERLAQVAMVWDRIDDLAGA